MRNWFPARIIILAALLVSFHCFAAAQEYPPEGTPVKVVEVRGTEVTEPSQVERVMELKAGSPFSAAALRRDLQAIANTGNYNPIATKITPEQTDEGLRIIVEVEENPTINRITFIGNVKYKAKRLLRELDFEEGEIFPVGARGLTSESLREFYALGGYKTTDVDVDVQPAEEAGKVNVIITIDEGEKIKIRDLIIKGNNHFPAWRIRMWAANSGSWFLFNNYWDPRSFDDDLRLIGDHYRDDGYLDAVAKAGEFKYDEEEAEISPVILISEGPRYRVKDVEITGHTLFVEREVRKPFAKLLGEYFSGNKLRNAVEELKFLYGDQGYANAEFDFDFRKNPDTGNVVLDVRITENDVVYVGDIFIKKDELDYEVDLNFLEEFIDWTSPGVTDETVRREVLLEPGEKYRTAQEVRTEQRLKRLGFFKEVDVYRQPTADPQVDNVIVDVKEDPAAGYVSVTAGVGEVTGPSIGVNYVNPNLFGEAKVLKAGALVGTRVSSFNIGYLDRHFMDTDNSFEYDIYREGVSYEGYDQRIYGTAAEFGHPFTEYVRGYVRPRVEHVRLERDDEDLYEDVGSYGVYALRGLLVRDVINDPIWPTEGYKISGGVEPGFAQNSFVKLLHTYEWVHSLDRQEDWVYYYGHNAGFMPNDADRVGISERFFIGGTSTLRGFQPHGIGPRDEVEHNVHVGGSTMLTQRHELRRRFGRQIAGRIFVDAGVLEEQRFHVDNPRIGTGAGVSVNLGALIVDLDLGYALLKERFDDTRVFHFRMRSNF